MFITDDNTFQEVVKRIVDAVHPDRIILFGSRARGEDISGSDMDLAVVVSGDIHRRNTAKKIYMSLIGVGRSVDVIVLKPEDLEKYRDSAGIVIPHVIREGKELYVA